MQEVEPGLWRWTGLHPAWTPEQGGPDGWEQEVGCVYLETAEAVLLIDPLVPPEASDRFWGALDRDIERLERPVVVVLCAPWHRRSTEAFVDRYGASVWAHDAAEGRLGLALDGQLPSDVTARSVPPDSEGQVVLLVEAHRTLVTAEVLAGAAGSLRVCPSPQRDDDSELQIFLRTLLELPIERVLPAHGAPVLADGREAIAAAIAHWAPSAA